MDIEWVRELCLSFPAVTEEEVWTDDLTFKVAGKMFAHTVLIPARVWLSFKAAPEKFAELQNAQGSFRPLTSLGPSGSQWKPRRPCHPRNLRPCCASPTTWWSRSFPGKPASRS